MQPSLLAITKEDGTNVLLPKSTAEVQAVRNDAAFGSGIYYAYFSNGIREVIGGPGIITPSQAPIQFEDEGVNLGTIGTVNEVDLVGAGVTASRVGDKVTINIPGGGGPATSQLLANAVFVDALNGSDIGGAKYTLMDAVNNGPVHKFQTITAALAAAISGDVIIVYPGEYTENSNLYKDGVVYYFYPGANVTRNDGSAIFEDATPGESCKVFGNANFISTGKVLDMQGADLYINCNNITATDNAVQITDGNVTIKCNDISNTNNPCLILKGGIIEIYCRNILSINDRAIFIDGSAAVNNKITIVANDIENLSSSASGVSSNTINIEDNGGGGFQGDISIIANRILGSPNWGALAGGRELFRIAYTTNNLTTLYVQCPELIYRSGSVVVDNSNTRGVIGTSTGQGNVRMIFNCNIFSDTQVGIAFRSGQTLLDFEFNGNIYCNEQPAIWCGSGFVGTGIKYINGRIISNNAAEGTVKIQQNIILELNGKIENTSALGVGINKLVNTSTLILNSIKIISTAASLSAPVADTYVGTMAVAKKIAAVNMTNAIAAGPVDYVDPLVQ